MPSSLSALASRLEAISARYGAAYGIDRGGDWFLLKVQEEMGELTQAYLAKTGRSRRDSGAAVRTLEDEAADVLCQFLLFARAEGIDLDAAIARKWLGWERVYGLVGAEEDDKQSAPTGQDAGRGRQVAQP